MKICHVTDYLPGYHTKWGGAQKAAYDTIQLLERKGLKSFVLTTRIDNNANEFRLSEIKTTEDYLGRLFGLLKILIPFDIISFFSSYSLLKKLKPDIVHIYNINQISFSIILASKKLRIPVVYSIYDYWPFCPIQVLSLPDGSVCKKFHGLRCFKCLKNRKLFLVQSFFAAFRKPLFNYFLRKVDKFLVLSNNSAGVLIDYQIPKEKISVIVLPPGDILKKYQKSAVQKRIKENSILFAGWLEPHKGLHIIIEALRLIVKKIPDVKLYILGLESKKEYKEKIQNIITKNNLQKNVLFLGRVNAKEKEDYMKRAGVVVVPEQWINMSPVVLIESMALGKAIVASDIGGVPEFIENGKSGLLASPKSSADFAQKIVNILKNQNFSLKISINAREKFKKMFDEKRIYADFKRTYKEILNNK